MLPWAPPRVCGCSAHETAPRRCVARLPPAPLQVKGKAAPLEVFSVTAMRGADVAASLAGLGVEKGAGRRRKRRQGRTNLQGDDTATPTPLNLVKAKDMIGREEPMEQVGMRKEFVHATTEQHCADGVPGQKGP